MIINATVLKRLCMSLAICSLLLVPPMAIAQEDQGVLGGPKMNEGARSTADGGYSMTQGPSMMGQSGRVKVPPRVWFQFVRDLDLEPSVAREVMPVAMKFYRQWQDFQKKQGQDLREIQKAIREAGNDDDARREMEIRRDAIMAEMPDVEAAQVQIWELLPEPSQEQLRISIGEWTTKETERRARRRQQRESSDRQVSSDSDSMTSRDSSSMSESDSSSMSDRDSMTVRDGQVVQDSSSRSNQGRGQGRMVFDRIPPRQMYQLLMQVDMTQQQRKAVEEIAKSLSDQSRSFQRTHGRRIRQIQQSLKNDILEQDERDALNTELQEINSKAPKVAEARGRIITMLDRQQADQFAELIKEWAESNRSRRSRGPDESRKSPPSRDPIEFE